MKKTLLKIYEKNNSSISIMYLLLNPAYRLLHKYEQIDDEVKNALSVFEPKNISKKDYKKLYKKLFVYRYIYSLRASEYYLYDFEKASYKERKEFMTRQLTDGYYSGINDRKFRKILDNKNLSYEIFKKYYKREMVCVSDKSNKKDFAEFAKNVERFILKPLSGHSGDGIEIIDVKKFKSTDELFEYTSPKIPYVAEGLIKQSKSLGCFHEKSVNTVRVVTFQYKGDISILWTFLRTGQGDHEVDNMGALGVGARIDENTGKIISDGVDWKGSKVKVHPDSKIQFKGFQIPKWNELIEFVKELAGEIADMHCVGWDLALTDNGWVLVEGNARPQSVTIQTFTKKGYRKYYDNMYNLVQKLKLEEGEADE